MPWTKLHSAVMTSPNGGIAAIEKIIKEGVLLDGQSDLTGITALHKAVECSGKWATIDIISLLLKKGALPDLKNKWGSTPLHWTVTFLTDKSEAIIDELVYYKANIFAKDNEGFTAKERAEQKYNIYLEEAKTEDVGNEIEKTPLGQSQEYCARVMAKLRQLEYAAEKAIRDEEMKKKKFIKVRRLDN